MPARVHVYGHGPRLRALCAVLVRAALPEAEIAEFAGIEEALAAAHSASPRTVVLDARVAPEPRAFAAYAEGAASAAAARGFDGTVRTAVAARFADGGSAQGDRVVIGDWLDDPEPSDPGSSGRNVEVHSAGFGHGGYASAGRNTIVGLRRAGVSVAWRQFYPERESVDIDPADRALLDELAAAQFQAERALVIQAPTHVTGQLFLERYVDAYAVTPFACYTMFETDGVPARWPGLLARADRVWVPSRFNVATFAAAGVPAERIDYVPLGLEVERFPLDGDTLEVSGRRRFAFLSVFGFSSRKGWDVLLEAWARAFDPDEDVSLILRTSAPNVDVRAEMSAFIARRGIDAARLAPIAILEQGLSAQALAALYRSADAFVLPSRGEGVGLPYLEAMAFGLPTIGTGWSGATEFLTGETGYLIDSSFELVDRMTTRTYPILRDQQWAAPSVDSTARALRAVFDDRASAALRAARGCVLARTQYNRTRTGRLAAEALERIVPASHPAVATRAAITYRGPLYSTGVRGSAGRTTIAALDRAGIGVRAEIADGPDQRAQLFLDDARLLKAALARTAESGASVVHVDPRAIEISGTFGVRRIAVPEVIDVERWTPQLGGLSGFGPAQTVRFLAVAHLDEHSGYDRVIGAFLRAFVPGDDVMLVIKVPAGPIDPARGQQLIAAAATRHAPGRAAQLSAYRISLAAGIVPEGDYMQMVGSFDAYVHVPHVSASSRALLEAMASALACIRLRSLDDGIERSEAAAFMVDDDLDAIAGAMREIAANPAAAAQRGHVARRAIVATHHLDVLGSVLRKELAASGLAGTIRREPVRTVGTLGIVVDARDLDHAVVETCLHEIAALTHREHRIVVLGQGDALANVVASLDGCRWIAYVRGDAVVTQSWDAILTDALDSRPFVELVVPRIIDAPEPQGFPRPNEPLAGYVRGLTVTQVGRGAQPQRIVTLCLMCDPPALRGALGRTDGTIDAAVRTIGKSAVWCASDTVIDRRGSAPWTLVEFA